MTIKVDLQNALEHDIIGYPLPELSELERWLNVAIDVIRSEKANGDVTEKVDLEEISQVQTEAFELTLRFVDTAESQQLNNDYRQQDKPTNVLSFEFEAPEHIQMSLLGDLVICAAVVEKEAKEQQKKPIEHLTHLCIHGLLHLLAYDHKNEDDAKEMENLEISILAKLNIDDPYRDQ